MLGISPTRWLAALDFSKPGIRGRQLPTLPCRSTFFSIASVQFEGQLLRKAADSSRPIAVVADFSPPSAQGPFPVIHSEPP
jgi:hypothetical protein